jgi:hypothetical protein
LYDPSESVICINREHAEFLLSQREDRRCLRYLFSIWAKESPLQEFGTDAEKVADEIVWVLAEPNRYCGRTQVIARSSSLSGSGTPVSGSHPIRV